MLSLIEQRQPLTDISSNQPDSRTTNDKANTSYIRNWFNLPPCGPYTTRVILVRHGRSTFNDQQRYQGSSNDSVLNAQGWQQAHRVGTILSSIPVDAVYASPLKRVRETTEGIAAKTSQYPMPAPIFSERLREINLPQWEGRCYKDVRSEEAIAYQCWLKRPHEFQMNLDRQSVVPLSSPRGLSSPGGFASSRGLDKTTTQALHPKPQKTFPILELYRQAQAFWQATLPNHPGQTILVVSHGGTNHALISTALGLSPRFHHRLQQSNGGISILDYSQPTSTAQLRVLNCTCHLGEPLPKLKAGKQGLRLLLLPVAPQSDRATDQLMQQTTTIRQHLADMPMAYSLTQTDPVAQAIAQQLFQDRTNLVQLQVQRHDFARQWHRALDQENHTDPAKKRLITGMAIAPIPTLQSLIAKTIRLRHGLAPTLPLSPGKLSVLHFPVGDHPPVLQALNLTHY
ncbi:MAG: histidine phosphatase family protein [Cyanobacteria bacterium P01_F01_bin.150]